MTFTSIADPPATPHTNKRCNTPIPPPQAFLCSLECPFPSTGFSQTPPMLSGSSSIPSTSPHGPGRHISPLSTPSTACSVPVGPNQLPIHHAWSAPRRQGGATAPTPGWSVTGERLRIPALATSLTSCGTPGQPQTSWNSVVHIQQTGKTTPPSQSLTKHTSIRKTCLRSSQLWKVGVYVNKRTSFQGARFR